MIERGPLRVESVSLRVGRRTIQQNITFDARPGQMVGIGGHSGCGKTTLLLVVAGLNRPADGSVTLGTACIDVVRHRVGVGFVFQHFGLLPYLTAVENLALVRPELRLSAEHRLRTAESVLRDVGLADVGNRLAQDLSGGQQQRLAVARALFGGPYLLVADEPTSELEAENRQRIMALLQRHARDSGIVILTSDDEEVLSVCDRQLRLDA